MPEFLFLWACRRIAVIVWQRFPARIRPATPLVDPAVASVASRLHVGQNFDGLSDDDLVALFDELEKDDFLLAGAREDKLEALKAEMVKAKNMLESDHGKLTEITDEKEVIRTSANEDQCVIHFYHRNFKRCDLMDKHLEILAHRHFKTRFLRVFVENVPWLVEKLQIKVLPCVICFIRGISKDRLIGFEELGNNDSFTTSALELRLAQSGVIVIGTGAGTGRETPRRNLQSSGIRRRTPSSDEDD